MLTYQEQIELREKVAKNEISIKLAKEFYWKDFKQGSRSWQTSDWKERRSKIIKEKCEICSSKETLTLQHLSHPRKYNEYENEVTRNYANNFIEANAIVEQKEFLEHLQNNYDYVPVPLCPKCENRKPNVRMRKSPKFLCTQCHQEFNEPMHKSVDELIKLFYENEDLIEIRDKCFVSKDKWKNNNNLKQVKYWLQREKAKSKDSELIEKEAFLLYLDDNIKYLSFTETITACKKCASYFDLYKMELCPKCHEYYKGIEYPSCIQCLPEDKRKLALEKLEFGKQWGAMERELGID